MKTLVIFLMIMLSSYPGESSPKDKSVNTCDPNEIIQKVVWWVAGDAHVSSHAAGLTQAISDINRLNLNIDFTIQLGDNVSDQHEYADLFIETMETVQSREWAYVLGNHDFGNDNKAVLPETYWGITMNNIRFLFISDEVDGRINRDLIMSDDQKKWFFNELETHRHKPFVIFSHQPHDEFAHFDELDFDNYDIKAWFHAHKHGWRINGLTEYGFHQLGINAISGHLDPRQSSVLTINMCEGKTEFNLKFRNHELEEWIDVGGEYDYFFTVD